MKKNYEEPKAEALEFNYTDTVVASVVPKTNRKVKDGCNVSEDGGGIPKMNDNQCNVIPTKKNKC